MPAATTTTAPDYPQQLHDAILATRNTLLANRATADGTSVTALGSLDVSRRTFADARLALADAHAGLTVSSYLDRKLVDASLTAGNGVTLATSSNTRAVATTAAVALAATSIKAASDAVDVVTRDVNGIAGITKSNDIDEPVDKAAKTAVEAVEKVARAVEQLKSLALLANIEAARPSTAAALQAAQASQASVAAILGTANSALAASNTAVTNAQAARTTDLTDLFSKSGQFTIAARDDVGLGTAITVVDRVENASLRASVNNAPELRGGPEVPGLQALCDLEPDVADDTREVRFYAVPSGEVVSFDFEAAHKSRSYARFAFDEKTHFGKRKDKVPCGALLRKDTDDHVLRYGQSYSVFFLRIPKVGQPRATDFSFATPPITSTVLLKFPEKPALFALPNGAFVTAFAGTDHAESVSAYQLFFAPSDVYEKAPGAELLIAGTLTAASYTSFDAKTQSCTHKGSVVTAAIRQEFLQEMRAFGPIPKELKDQIDLALKPVGKWIQERHPTLRYLAYFSPNATKDGWQKGGGFTIARYNDMYGDFFDFERRAYYGLALAVGLIDRKLLQQAANVLSDPSVIFPPKADPEPSPVDATRKATK